MKKLLLSLILGTSASLLLLTEYRVFFTFLYSLALVMLSTGHIKQNELSSVKSELIVVLVIVVLLLGWLYMEINYPSMQESLNGVYSHPLFALATWIIFMLNWMRHWLEYKRNRETLSQHTS